VRQQRQAEELARVARLVNETLDLPTVSERIAESVLGMLRVTSSAIRLIQPDGSLKAIALGGRAKEYAANRETVPAGVGLVGRAAAEGRAMWTEDSRTDGRFATSAELRERNAAAGIVAGLAVPLRVMGRVIGALSVGNPEPRVFSEAEIGLLQSFADQAAIAINNAQNQQALASQAERLRILREIDRALLAEQSPDAIAEAAARPLRELLGIPRVIVNIFDLAAGRVEWLAAAGRRRSHTGPGIRYPLRMAGDLEALKRGEPQILNVDAMPPSPEAEALLASGVHVYMVVPMIAGGELIGSVSICAAAEPFPPEQVSIAQEAATQLAIAIVQARLHERVKQQAAELEVRVEERTRELRVATAEADRANQAKSEFLSRMSHELRTPLNAILGFAQLLELDLESPEQQESVTQILRAGRHLLGLINEILDISRIEAGRLQLSLEPVPLHETVRQAIELVQPSAADAHVTVRAEAIGPAVHVLADRQRLQQVLLNLLSNGVKYNHSGGTVTVVCAAPQASRLRIEVRDTGPGIAADKLARLFTPFDRLGAEGSAIEGTGLGLALSKSLVEAMGGTLQARSEVARGSTFAVELTTVAPPAEAAPAPSPGSPAVVGEESRGALAREAHKILYIEDNLSNLALVESILSRRPGTTVLSAMQGRVGVDLARDHRPSLILLDRHLPDIPGEEVFRLLQADARTREIPVIVLSADAMPSRMRQFLDGGVRAYLTKPLDVPALLAAIDEALRGGPRPDPS
jgi:signal transduction histidine kinase/putative methionine-R-sulfoxide reductase with GAF domain/ActR/RegA family two-component response regulator